MEPFKWGGRFDDSVPGEVTTTDLPGKELHDLQRGRHAYPKFAYFHQGVDQISLVGAIFVTSPLKTGTNLRHRHPPPFAERLKRAATVLL